ncbi:MAG: hypothetical protein K8F25_12705, partial [Fimbriimonadaceae bacterium]|nr:hypothetical protein [Alphaproteobacteria bacterium]
VHHSARNMFDLVADVERYPEFVPLCAGLRINKRIEHDDRVELICDMTVAYKVLNETFTCQVMLNESARTIEVKYLDGPFRRLDNIWTFAPLDKNLCDVGFFIEYEFSSRAFQLVAGAVFDRAFHKFSAAFEARADRIYGVNRQRV